MHQQNNGKNQFYKKLNLSKPIKTLIREYNKIKKLMIDKP